MINDIKTEMKENNKKIALVSVLVDRTMSEEKIKAKKVLKRYLVSKCNQFLHSQLTKWRVNDSMILKK